MWRESRSRKLFVLCNALFLSAVSLLCVLPIIHVIAISFSSADATAANWVSFWPVQPTLASYKYILDNKHLATAFLVSLKRELLGVSVNMLLTVLIAYPLSKEATHFKPRTLYVWVFVFTILFSGGLIPTYMVVYKTGLLNSLWALILPGAVPVFSVILLINFFRGLPKEIEEAAYIDGAGHWSMLWKLYIPLSTPAIATLTLFAMVGHWNSWFDGLIYMNSPDNYPLQTYLQTVVIQKELNPIYQQDPDMLKLFNNRSLKAAQIFLAMLPILLVYPFLQKYFVKGIVLGSVKE